MSTRPLLNGPIHAIPVDNEPNEMELLQEQIADLEETLNSQAAKIDAMEQFLKRIQHGLASIFSDVPVETASTPKAGRPGVWDSWKRKFPGKCADMIDALLEQGELSRFSLASLTAQNPRSGSYNQNIYKLNKHELIVKRGDKITLRSL